MGGFPKDQLEKAKAARSAMEEAAKAGKKAKVGRRDSKWSCLEACWGLLEFRYF